MSLTVLPLKKLKPAGHTSQCSTASNYFWECSACRARSWRARKWALRIIWMPLFVRMPDLALAWARTLPLAALEALKATCKTIRRQLAATFLGLGHLQKVLAILRTRRDLDRPAKLALRLTCKLLAARMPRPGTCCLTPFANTDTGCQQRRLLGHHSCQATWC